MIRTFHLLLFMLLAIQVSAQEPMQSTRRRISGPEKWWAVKHLFIAHRALSLTKAALAETMIVAGDTVLDGDTRGGQVDAFRHSYWMALLCQKIKAHKALKLGIAHEKGNYKDFKKGRLEDGLLPDKVSSAMDLYNNEKGADTGFANQSLEKTALKTLIIQRIKAGEMVIVYKNKDGFLKCNDEKIDMNSYNGVWDIPKCLVPSNKGK